MQSPNAALKKRDIELRPIVSPEMFLPFGQKGNIVNTAPLMKKLDVRAIQAQYLRALGPDLLLVWKTESKAVATIRAKEFIPSQHTPRPKESPKSLFEQPHAMTNIDNSDYDAWYPDSIVHPTNTRSKVQKVGNMRVPRKKEAKSIQAANFLVQHRQGLDHLRKRKAFVPNNNGLSAQNISFWYDPEEERKDEARCFPRPGR